VYVGERLAVSGTEGKEVSRDVPVIDNEGLALGGNDWARGDVERLLRNPRSNERVLAGSGEGAVVRRV
jgi:hypothetical protein